MNKELTERFIRYVKKETRSDETSQTVPTTPSQTAFLKDLEQELNELGFQEVYLNPKNSFLTATIPSNVDHEVPTIGFIAHVDTADFEAVNIHECHLKAVPFVVDLMKTAFHHQHIMFQAAEYYIFV